MSLFALFAASFLPPLPSAQAKTEAFDGYVSASGPNWLAHTFAVTQTGPINVVLDWDSATADLNVSLRDPTDTVVAKAWTSAKPETLTYEALATGQWKVVVSSKAGGANYALTVVHSSGFPRTSANVRNWAPTFMTWPLYPTKEEAIQAATNFDVIGAGPNVYRWVADMKQVNPDLRILSYLNAGMAKPTEGSSYPESWYAHDAGSNKITQSNSGGGSGWYLMEPSRWGWVMHVADQCAADLASSGYDGCLLDSLGTAALYPGYMSALPVNPSTGVTYTKSKWLAATSYIAKQVKVKVGDSLVVPNGLHSGLQYFDFTAPTRRLIASTGVDGGMAELFIRGPNDEPTRFKTEAGWKKDVDMLGDAEAAGKALLVVTKMWVSATAEQKDDVHEYALASFLQGTKGLSYFEFMYDRDSLRTSPYWEIDLGAPLASYSKVGGVYRRSFSKGLVLVNPTPDTVTVPLGASYVTLDGAVVSQVTLGPNSARILRNP